MSGHRRRKGHAEEHHVDERWLVSYSDMITVLMALFIVLYALSTVNQKKFDELKNSLASGFGVTKSQKVDANTGIVPKQFVKKHGAGFSSTTLSVAAEAKEVRKYLAQAGASAQVKTGATTVTISLVGSSAYFGGNQAALRPEAITVLHAIAPTLEKHVGKITIEGHAAPQGSAGAFGSDWNLASNRAQSVLFYLLGHDEVDQANVSLISYGSEQALRGDSPEIQQKNRRVDIVLHQPPAASTTEAAVTETSTTSTGSGSKPATTAEPAAAKTAAPTESAAAKTEAESIPHH